MLFCILHMIYYKYILTIKQAITSSYSPNDGSRILLTKLVCSIAGISTHAEPISISLKYSYKTIELYHSLALNMSYIYVHYPQLTHDFHQDTHINFCSLLQPWETKIVSSIHLTNSLFSLLSKSTKFTRYFNRMECIEIFVIL